MTIKTLLVEEVQDELDNLSDLELGSEEYKTTVDGLTKLIDRVIDIEKLESENKDKVENRENENDFKLKQMDEERKDRWIRNGIAAAGVIIPSLVTIWGTVKSLKFEEEGTITTVVGRGFINKLLPKK